MAWEADSVDLALLRSLGLVPGREPAGGRAALVMRLRALGKLPSSAEPGLPSLPTAGRTVSMIEATRVFELLGQAPDAVELGGWIGFKSYRIQAAWMERRDLDRS